MKDWLKSTLGAIVELPPMLKLTLLAIFDSGVAIGSVFLIFVLQVPALWPFEAVRQFTPILLSSMLIAPLSLGAMGLYRQMVRHADLSLFLDVIKGITLAIIIIKILSSVLFNAGLTYELLAQLWAFLVIGTLGTRFLAKWIIRKGRMEPVTSRTSIAIFGAGEAGVSLLNALDRSIEMQVVAMFDDDRRFDNRKIKNCTVYHSSKLEDMLRSLKISQVIIAIPSISHKMRKNLFERLETLGVRVRILPSADELVGGRVQLSHVRDIKASDLLIREAHQPDPVLIRHDVSGKNVMVTGGGGSIGSELCRQIVLNHGRRIIIVENSEYAIYTIERDLIELAASNRFDVDIIPILGNVCNGLMIEKTMKLYDVETVYHAAAYKHVSMVECNISEGVRNNVFGTLTVARSSLAVGVKKMILISTDKAVRPTNVMGASKRLSEMTLQAIQNLKSKNTKTRFTMVRFGNVLDSAGSVVPLFRRQIREGGPLTLTHRDVTRFFMTIPEASQLVLQAGAMAMGGEVFILDMGESTHIYDLAVRMIHLSGLSVMEEDNQGGDIKIQITGLRTGEKWHEELFLTNDVRKTEHESILHAKESFIPWEDIEQILDRLEKLVDQADNLGVKNILEEVVEGYSP